MKKHLLIYCCLCLAFIGLRAQDNIVKINALSTLALYPKISFERVITDKSALQFTAGYKIPRSLPNAYSTSLEGTETELKYNGYYLELDYKLYKDKGKTPDGKYLAPFVSFNNWSVNYNDAYEGFEADIKMYMTNLGVGLLFGKQKVYGNNFALDVFWGFGLSKTTFGGSFSTNDPTIDYSSVGDDIETEFSDIGFIAKRLEITSTSNSVKAKVPMFLPILKFGVSLGFGF